MTDTNVIKDVEFGENVRYHNFVNLYGWYLST